MRFNQIIEFPVFVFFSSSFVWFINLMLFFTWENKFTKMNRFHKTAFWQLKDFWKKKKCHTKIEIDSRSHQKILKQFERMNEWTNDWHKIRIFLNWKWHEEKKTFRFVHFILLTQIEHIFLLLHFVFASIEKLFSFVFVFCV